MSDDLFTLAGRRFAYQHGDYNATRRNERAVEVPVALSLLAQATSVLEVGAVLPHYGAEGHLCIDLHEQYEGVTNADVLTYAPPGQFDLIVCISTLDHLRDEDEFETALARMRSWLSPGGLLYVTLPYGQPAWVGGGRWLDRLLETDLPRCADATWRLDKVDGERHLWREVADDSPRLGYNGPTPYANSVYLLLWGDVESWWSRVTGE